MFTKEDRVLFISAKFLLVCVREFNNFKKMQQIPRPQRIILATIPIATGILSLVGSLAIIFVLLNAKKGLSTTYRRLLFGMSVMDVFQSLAIALSTFPSPKNTPGAWLAIGNQTTCDLQGLMFYGGAIGTSIYNCNLCIYFVLIVVKNISQTTMEKRVEPFFHSIAILYCLSSGVFLLVNRSFNSNGQICWIAHHPVGCKWNPSLECTRGVNASKYRMTFQGTPVIVLFLIISVTMVYLIITVRRTQRRTAHRRLSWSSTSKVQEQPIKQAKLYVLAYFLTFIFPLLYAIVASTSGGKVPFALAVISQIFAPLQGFMNFAIFMRPEVNTAALSHPEKSFFSVAIIVLKEKLKLTSRENQDIVINKHDSKRSVVKTPISFNTSRLHDLLKKSRTNISSSKRKIITDNLSEIPDN